MLYPDVWRFTTERIVLVAIDGAKATLLFLGLESGKVEFYSCRVAQIYDTFRTLGEYIR